MAAAVIVPSVYSAPRRYAYEQWDVFTRTPLTGNPLAVFLDATGLSDSQMQAIARETNLSETTFVFPRDAKTEAEKGTRVRIFNREQELPFAGHPTLGTARALLARSGKEPPTKIVLDLNAGQIPVLFEDAAGYGEMIQKDAVNAETHDAAAIAPLLGLLVTDFETDYPIRNVSTGRPKLMVMLRSLAAIRRIEVDWNATEKYFATGDKQRGMYLMTRETESKTARVHARLPGRSGEDPATGSAAGCAAAYLVETGIAKPNERFIIEQGTEISRPSEIYASAAAGLKNVRVGGYCAKVFEGAMTL